VAAVVSRGGRPDLAGAVLGRVRAPTLLVVGGRDRTVLARIGPPWRGWPAGPGWRSCPAPVTCSRSQMPWSALPSWPSPDSSHIWPGTSPPARAAVPAGGSPGTDGQRHRAAGAAGARPECDRRPGWGAGRPGGGAGPGRRPAHRPGRAARVGAATLPGPADAGVPAGRAPPGSARNPRRRWGGGTGGAAERPGTAGAGAAGGRPVQPADRRRAGGGAGHRQKHVGHILDSWGQPTAPRRSPAPERWSCCAKGPRMTSFAVGTGLGGRSRRGRGRRAGRAVRAGRPAPDREAAPPARRCGRPHAGAGGGARTARIRASRPTVDAEVRELDAPPDPHGRVRPWRGRPGADPPSRSPPGWALDSDQIPEHVLWG
jgi:hypothetical protein